MDPAQARRSEEQCRSRPIGQDRGAGADAGAAVLANDRAVSSGKTRPASRSARLAGYRDRALPGAEAGEIGEVLRGDVAHGAAAGRAEIPPVRLSPEKVGWCGHAPHPRLANGRRSGAPRRAHPHLRGGCNLTALHLSAQHHALAPKLHRDLPVKRICRWWRGAGSNSISAVRTAPGPNSSHLASGLKRFEYPAPPGVLPAPAQGCRPGEGLPVVIGEAGSGCASPASPSSCRLSARRRTSATA